MSRSIGATVVRLVVTVIRIIHIFYIFRLTGNSFTGSKMSCAIRNKRQMMFKVATNLPRNVQSIDHKKVVISQETYGSSLPFTL